MLATSGFSALARCALEPASSSRPTRAAPKQQARSAGSISSRADPEIDPINKDASRFNRERICVCACARCRE